MHWTFVIGVAFIRFRAVLTAPYALVQPGLASVDDGVVANGSDRPQLRYQSIQSAAPPIDKNDPVAVCSLIVKYDASCWNLLNVSGFLLDWRATLPECAKSPDKNLDQCYNSTKTWSTNFLFLMSNNNQSNCEEITSTTCDLAKVGPRQDLSDQAQIRYVIRAIHASYSFFTTWWETMSFALDNASKSVPGIINTLDKLQKKYQALDLVLSIAMVGIALAHETSMMKLAAALSADKKAKKSDYPSSMDQHGRPIPAPLSGPLDVPTRPDFSPKGLPDAPRWKLPDVPASELQKTTAKSINDVTWRAMIFSPFLARVLWPATTDDSRQVQIGQLGHLLDDLTSGIQTRLKTANMFMMNDLEVFLNSTQNGTFASNDIPSIDREYGDVLIGLKTWLMTTAMNGNGFTVWTGMMNSDGLNYTLDSAAYNFGCEPDNHTGVCTVKSKRGHQGQRNSWTTYPSFETQNFYSFDKLDPNNIVDPDISPIDIINEAVSKNWTTMELLFDASYLCQERSKQQKLQQQEAERLREIGGPGSNSTQNSTDPSNANSSDSSTLSKGGSNASVAISRRDTQTLDQPIGFYEGLDFVCVGQLQINDGCNWNKFGSPTPWGIAKTNPDACSNFYSF